MGYWISLALQLSEAHDNSDNSDKSPPKVVSEEPIVPFVTNVRPSITKDGGEAEIIAWINHHPPDIPATQSRCAACDELISANDNGWVYLGDGALIHYSGKHGKDCWRRWSQKRRDVAKLALRAAKEH
jgi:hypothetical protein